MAALQYRTLSNRTVAALAVNVNSPKRQPTGTAEPLRVSLQ